jgi:hypothetical protein
MQKSCFSVWGSDVESLDIRGLSVLITVLMLMLKGIYVLHFSSLVYRYNLTNCVPILDFVLMGLSV